MATIALTILGFIAYSIAVHQYIIAYKKAKTPFWSTPIVDESTIDPIHNRFLLDLAIEADEMRQKEQLATNAAEQAQYHQSVSMVSLEVVDMVLSMNGFDPHVGEVFDESGEEVDTKVIDFSSYPKTK